MKSVFIYVQHLLGVGHLHRTALIAQALVKQKFKVSLISGGMPVDGLNFGEIDFIQLPAIKTDTKFSALYDQYDNEIDADFKASRRQKLLNAYQSVNPDLVLIETYPFGRRQVRFELLPLLEMIVKQVDAPKVCCSIRDVIQPKSRADRVDEIINLVDKYFDFVLVHGDEYFISFDQSFPKAQQFKSKLVYTGYIAKPKLLKSAPPIRQKNSILVSAGGGVAGEQLYQTALAASQTPNGKKYHWHILIGHNLSHQAMSSLRLKQAGNLRIEPNRNDFFDLLTQSWLSISQGGYNTIMDVLVSEVSSIIVPFQGQGEVEQIIRARVLQRHGRIKLLKESELNVDELLKVIDDITVHKWRSKDLNIDMDGASKTAEFLYSIA